MMEESILLSILWGSGGMDKCGNSAIFLRKGMSFWGREAEEEGESKEEREEMLFERSNVEEIERLMEEWWMV